MQIPTVTIVLEDGSEAVINESDYDAKIHTLAGQEPEPAPEPAPEPTKPAAKTTATKAS